MGLETSTCGSVGTPHPKWRLLVPIFVLLATAGALVLFPRYNRAVPGATQVVASVTETDSSASSALATHETTKAAGKSAPTAALPSTHALEPARQRTTTLTLDMMKERQQYQIQRQQWMVQAGVSLLMALASLFIILSKKYPEEGNKWAYSTIAFIMGYWLKT
jgi:hypothetical protein